MIYLENKKARQDIEVSVSCLAFTYLKAIKQAIYSKRKKRKQIII